MKCISSLVWSLDVAVGVRGFTLLNIKCRKGFNIENITQISFKHACSQRAGFHILLTVSVSYRCIRVLEHRFFNVRGAPLQFIKLNIRRQTDKEDLIVAVKQSFQGSSEIRKKAFQLHLVCC